MVKIWCRVRPNHYIPPIGNGRRKRTIPTAEQTLSASIVKIHLPQCTFYCGVFVLSMLSWPLFSKTSHSQNLVPSRTKSLYPSYRKRVSETNNSDRRANSSGIHSQNPPAAMHILTMIIEISLRLQYLQTRHRVYCGVLYSACHHGPRFQRHPNSAG